MVNPELKDRRRAQKESLLFRELSQLFMRLTIDDSKLAGLTLNRVALSKNKSSVTLYFYIPGGPEAFKERKDALVLYKPSLRKALSQAIPARYTPELVFAYDHLFEKQTKVDTLLEQIKKERSSS